MRTILVILATLVAVALTGQLWLLCTDMAPLAGYVGFTVTLLGVAWLVGVVAWISHLGGK